MKNDFTARDGWPLEARRFRDALHRAHLLIAAEKWEHALREVQQALAIDPEHAQAHLLAGNCYLALEQIADARREATEVLRLDPDESLGYYLFARIALHVKKYSEALYAIERALEIVPLDVDYLALRALILLNSGKPREGLAAAEHALQIDPESRQAHHVRAIAQLNLGRRSEAARATMRSLVKDPENALSWYERGVQFFYEGKVAEAKYALLQALAIDPELQLAQQKLREVLGATHPFFAPGWWVRFYLKRLPALIQFYLVLSPLALTGLCCDGIAKYPHWAGWLQCALLLLWLLIIYIISGMALLGVALRRGWISTRVLAEEEEKWAHAEEQARQVMALFEEGKECSSRGDAHGARQVLLTALRVTPDDQEIQDAFTATFPAPSWRARWWSLIFWLFRLPEKIRRLNAWGRIILVAAVLVGFLGLVIIPVILLLLLAMVMRMALRKGWVHE